MYSMQIESKRFFWLSRKSAQKQGSEKMQTRTEKWVKNDFRRTPIDFTMQRRLFYDATEAVLPCKTASVAV